jgi:AmmeMemoRadiSam system protein B/AmmeMemoRadiSam system protein A
MGNPSERKRKIRLAFWLAIGGGAVLFFFAHCPKEAAAKEEGRFMKEDIRRPAVAGSFYPADAQTLSTQVKEFLARASKREIKGEIVALISPHAGYMYSGQVAAHSFALIAGMKFDAVLVVAPSHRVAFQGASVYDRGAYQTPLGLLPVAQELAQQLMKESNLIRFFPQAHGPEHSLEVQLPFLQEVLGEFSLVPVVIGDQSFRTCEKVGQAIARTIQGKKVLLVASTDLSHFHPYEDAVKLDQVILKGIEQFDPQKLSADLEAGKGEACGGGPVVAVMVAARELGANRARVLKYMNSGDVTGDRSGVVGYAAAVLYREEGGPEKEKGPRKAGVSLGLTAEEKMTLRQIAQAAIEGKLKKEKPPKVENLTATLREKRGAFVSLHSRGQLRGCIGLIQAAKALHLSVEEMAMAAAFNDPRFPPVSVKELKDLEIEISVLTPLTRMKEEKEIEVGKHGLYIKKGFYSGLLLPQVATEYNWDPITFLEETCRKAGLPRKAWKDPDAEIYLFSADIF